MTSHRWRKRESANLPHLTSKREQRRTFQLNARTQDVAAEQPVHQLPWYHEIIDPHPLSTIPVSRKQYTTDCSGSERNVKQMGKRATATKMVLLRKSYDCETYLPTGFPDHEKPLSNSCSLCSQRYESTKWPLHRCRVEWVNAAQAQYTTGSREKASLLALDIECETTPRTAGKHPQMDDVGGPEIWSS